MSQPRIPAPPKGTDLLHAKGGGRSTPTPQVHREPSSTGKPVKTK